MKNVKANRFLRLGAIITTLTVGFILLGCVWTPYPPNAIDTTARMLSPSLEHLMYPRS